jgi:hypothetical protein
LVLSLFVSPTPKIQHQDSSAFQTALQQAVSRLEGSGKVLLAGTATPALAGGAQTATFDGAYTCQTYDIAINTCDPGRPECVVHTADPLGHTCVGGEYTCQMATCDTYDPSMPTCDPNKTECTGAAGHTFEPPPYNHTCEGHTCDGAFTCDFTVDPRAWTCDAADIDCLGETFDAFMETCNPMLPECQINNPHHCTAQAYDTCDPSVPTCELGNPDCETVDPQAPNCGTPVERTTWGKVKVKYAQ